MQNAERRRGTGPGYVDSGSHEAERPAPPKPQAKAGDNGRVQNVSDSPDQVLDVIVIGAGPVGLACAIEARNAGLTARVLDKGALVNSIVGYPARMEFFSTPDLIEIGGHPFPVQGYKPTREEGLEYYRGVAAREAVDVQALRAGHRPAWRAGRVPRRDVARRPSRTSCHRRDRVLRSAESPRCARRGPAARHALLSRALPVRPAAGRHHRREELRGQGRPRLLSTRRAGHAGRSRRHAVRVDQVLDQARPREPHQGRVDSRFLQQHGRGDPRDVAPAGAPRRVRWTCPPTSCSR